MGPENRARRAQIGPKWRSRAPDGSAPLFLNEINRTNSEHVMAILRFFRPGHPSMPPKLGAQIVRKKRNYYCVFSDLVPFLDVKNVTIRV